MVKFIINISLLISVLFSSAVFATGEATVLRWQGAVTIDGVVLQHKGALVKQGANISALGAHDFVDLRLGDGSLVRLKEGQLKTTKVSATQNVFELLTGKLYSLIQKASQADSFMVQTKSAVMGVRGTKFMVQEETSKTYLCVCEGSVAAKTKTTKAQNAKGAGTGGDGAGDAVIVRKNEDIDMYPTQALTKPKAASAQMAAMVLGEFEQMMSP